MLFTATASSAQISQQHWLLALSKSDHTLAVIDPGTLKIIARIPVGSDPHEVIASSDGKRAYVSIYGGGSMHELSVIDLVNKKALKTIDTRPLMGPHGLTYVNNKLWFTTEGSKTVGRFDPVSQKVDWVMGTGQDRTHMIYVSTDGEKVYTTNIASGTVSILEESIQEQNPGGFRPPPHREGANIPGQRGLAPPPRKNWVQTLIPVSKGSEGFDVSPDGRELWTAASDDGTIAIIDLPAKKIKTTLDAKVIGANRLKFTPDGKRVLVTSLRSGDLFVYDAASHKEIKRIPTGHGAAGILIDDAGKHAYIGCTEDNYVAVVDLQSLTVTGHIAIRGADGLAWAVKQ